MRVTALLGLLLAGTVSGASAQFPQTVGTRILDGICGTGGSNVTFTTCYSVEIVSKYNASGNPMLVLKVRNLAGTTPGAIITGIALDNLPLSLTFIGMSGPYRGGAVPQGWTASANKTFEGAPDPNQEWDTAVLWGGAGTGNSITNTCDPNEPNTFTTAECGNEAALTNTGNPWVRFNFTLSSPLKQSELEQLAMNVRFRYVYKDENENDVVSGFHCIEGETCAAIVPEPVTIVLLGTGLAAMGLLRRRRRNGDIADG